MENYDILLIRVRREYEQGFINAIGQLSILGYMKRLGLTGRCFVGDGYECKRVMKEQLESGATKIVGLYACDDGYKMAKHVLSFLKQYNVTTVLGGPHVVAFDEESFRYAGCDYAIEGEGEIPLSRLLCHLLRGAGALSDIEGLRYLDETGAYHCIPQGHPVQKLDEIPFEDPNDMLNEGYDERKLIGILSGRGCPFRCGFCYEGANAKNVRFRSAENVLAEIDHIRNYNKEMQGVIFYDDTFTINNERLRTICLGLKERKLAFVCEGHVQTLYKDPELLPFMAKCGLVSMQIGLESGSRKVLDSYNKKSSPEMIREVVRMAKEAGLMMLEGNFIIGGALESRQTLAESRALAEELITIGRGMFVCKTIFFVPYHDTPITKDPAKYGMCFDKDQIEWTLSDMGNCTVSTLELSRDELVEEKFAFDRFLEEVYNREAQFMTKDELQLYYYKFQGYSHVCYRWHDRITSDDRLRRFVQNGFKYRNLFDENAVITRTFETLRYDGQGTLIAGPYRFTGHEKAFLELSTGEYSIPQLARRIGVTEQETYHIYDKMYNLCLAYQNLF